MPRFVAWRAARLIARLIPRLVPGFDTARLIPRLVARFVARLDSTRFNARLAPRVATRFHATWLDDHRTVDWRGVIRPVATSPAALVIVPVIAVIAVVATIIAAIVLVVARPIGPLTPAVSAVVVAIVAVIVAAPTVVVAVIAGAIRAPIAIAHDRGRNDAEPAEITTGHAAPCIVVDRPLTLARDEALTARAIRAPILEDEPRLRTIWPHEHDAAAAIIA